jgi:hypothetical protein
MQLGHMDLDQDMFMEQITVLVKHFCKQQNNQQEEIDLLQQQE